MRSWVYPDVPLGFEAIRLNVAPAFKSILDQLPVGAGRRETHRVTQKVITSRRAGWSQLVGLEIAVQDDLPIKQADSKRAQRIENSSNSVLSLVMEANNVQKVDV
jgi:hypothetical protein